VTRGRLFAAVGVVALVVGMALMLFPSLLDPARDSDIPMTTDPVVINAVKGRQSGFREMGTAVKNIDERITAGLVFDVELLADVHNLATNADQIPFWFPAGSGPEAGLEMEALPEIWRSRGNFNRLDKRLLEEIDKLEAVARERQQAEFVAQFGTLTGVCDECHETYRQEQD